jgi:hypothetical protein
MVAASQDNRRTWNYEWYSILVSLSSFLLRNASDAEIIWIVCRRLITWTQWWTFLSNQVFMPSMHSVLDWEQVHLLVSHYFLDLVPRGERKSMNRFISRKISADGISSFQEGQFASPILNFCTLLVQIAWSWFE